MPRWRRDRLFAERSARLLAGLEVDVVLGVRHTPQVDVWLARGGLYSDTLHANGRPWTRWLPKYRTLLALERELLGRPNPPLVIAPSEMVRAACLRQFSLPSERVVVVRTGVDLTTFRPATDLERARLRQDLGWNEHETVVLFAAHNFRLKGLDCLLRAWQQLPRGEFRLVVAGRGKLRQRLGADARVEFLGVQHDMVRLYQAADVLAHPTFYDPFSRVVIEALACGLPVITTRCNGAAEILTDGQEGIVIDRPTDIARLTWAIAQFREPQPARRHAARQLAEKYPETEFLAQTVAAIEAEARRRHRRA